MNEAIISHRGPGHLWLASLGRRGMELGLERVQTLLDRLDRPDRAQPNVVVAGTDGKGSTSSMLTVLLQASGLRVGHYTSPHLRETRERVWIAGACVTAEELDAALEQTSVACARQPALDPTPFEALTAAAWILFARAELDVAVMEVGLGGRLDAVNACDPIVSVVTHLSHDHMAVLGRTLAEIAFEKCGVARDGRMLVAAQPSLCKSALRKHGRSPRLVGLAHELVVGPFALRGPDWRSAGVLSGPALVEALELEVGLPGAHQLENAGLAVGAWQGVAEWFAVEQGRTLPPVEDVVPALAHLDWPCRAEVVEQGPLLVLDAAHNPAGTDALAALLAERGRAWQIVLAVRKDRDPAEVVRALAPIAATFWLPRMSGETLLEADLLSDVIDTVAPGAGVAVGSSAKCLAEARREVGKGPGVVVTGSQHALGEWLGQDLIRSPRLERRLGRTPDAQQAIDRR
ncbi:MAG: bifunctional folylpolyglutamate synthase/dihydrofolate synthase [Myxococcota bacterium]